MFFSVQKLKLKVLEVVAPEVVPAGAVALARVAPAEAGATVEVVAPEEAGATVEVVAPEEALPVEAAA